MEPEDDRFIAKLESRVIIYLAGRAAERRALRGSAPGWIRFRSHEEVVALHEAAHGIAQWSYGLHVWKINVLEHGDVLVGESRLTGAFSAAGTSTDPPALLNFSPRGDLSMAVGVCNLLSTYEPISGWRTTLHIARRLRARARAFVDQHWLAITVLAEELVRSKELNRAQVESILTGRVRRTVDTSTPYICR